jgi:hypothetical protein
MTALQKGKGNSSILWCPILWCSILWCPITKGTAPYYGAPVPHHKNGKHLFSNNTCSNGMLRPPAGHDMTKDTRTWAVMNMTPPITFTNSIRSPVITPSVNTHCSRKVLRLLYIYLHLYLFNSHLITTCKEHSFKLQNF